MRMAFSETEFGAGDLSRPRVAVVSLPSCSPWSWGRRRSKWTRAPGRVVQLRGKRHACRTNNQALRENSNQPYQSLALDVARNSPLRNFIPTCLRVPWLSFPPPLHLGWFSFILMISPYTHSSPPAEAVQEPSVPVAARFPLQGPEVAALGPRAPQTIVAGPPICPLPSTDTPRKARKRRSARPRGPPGLGQGRDPQSYQPGTVPGARSTRRGQCWMASYISRWKVQRRQQRLETGCLVGLKSAAGGRSLGPRIAPGDPGEV